MYSWVIFLISISVNSPLTAKYFIIFTSLVCLSLGIEGSSENSCLLRLKEQAVKNKTKSWRRLKCCIELRGAAEKGDHFSGFITTSNLFHITLTQTKHFDESSFNCVWLELSMDSVVAGIRRAGLLSSDPASHQEHRWWYVHTAAISDVAVLAAPNSTPRNGIHFITTHTHTNVHTAPLPVMPGNFVVSHSSVPWNH